MFPDNFFFRDFYAEATIDGGFIAAAYAMTSPNDATIPFAVKCDSDGGLTWKAIDDFENNSEVKGIMSDSDGNVCLLGCTKNSNNIKCPMIVKLGNDLQTLNAFYQEIDVDCTLYCGEASEQGNLYLVGNTVYHGMLFVYDSDMQRLGYDIYGNSTDTESVYQSISLTPEGNAIVSSSYRDENWKEYSLVICYDTNADKLWQYTTSADNGTIYLFDAAQTGQTTLAIGISYSSIGAQAYTLELNDNHEFANEFYSPAEYGFSTFQYGYTDIVGGKAYISWAYKMGPGVLGSVECFGDTSIVNIPTLNCNDKDGIVLTEGQARMADGSEAEWTLYSLTGIKTLCVKGNQIDLTDLQSGIYIITANTDKGTFKLKFAK